MNDFQFPLSSQPEPSSNRRTARLESLLKREIASAVTQEIRDPRLGFVTITRCELSKDGSECFAYYTVFGNPTKRKLTGEALDSARGYIQSKYAKQVRMRTLPRLRFRYDEDEEERIRVETALRQARREADADSDDQTD